MFCVRSRNENIIFNKLIFKLKHKMKIVVKYELLIKSSELKLKAIFIIT